jgi:hypothetical protein
MARDRCPYYREYERAIRSREVARHQQVENSFQIRLPYGKHKHPGHV